jgi:hypothetical protein
MSIAMLNRGLLMQLNMDVDVDGWNHHLALTRRHRSALLILFTCCAISITGHVKWSTWLIPRCSHESAESGRLRLSCGNHCPPTYESLPPLLRVDRLSHLSVTYLGYVQTTPYI